MTMSTNVFIAAAVAALIAGASSAQTTVFDIQDSPVDAVQDLEDDIADDFDRDLGRFGNEGRELGFTGSVSARATLTDGNTNNSDLGLGARVGYFDGVNGNDFTLSYTFGETEGMTTENRALIGYDYTREFGSSFYAFGKAVYAYDEFGTYEEDAFLGAGIGYRIFNTNDQQWSVQAGPGYRLARAENGDEVNEVAASLSSDYSYRFSDTVLLTNDTDILTSETDTYVTNELGVNLSMSDALALRTSILTEYRTDPQPGFENTDNTLGVSVVYSFN